MQKISFRNDILPLKDKLFRLALCITRNREEAEDIVQDTMLRVWNRREEWNVWETVEGFCLTICRNLAIDRSQKMDARHVELTPEVTELPDMAAPDKLMERDERLGLLHRLIAELPEKQRTILQLRDVEGKSYKEIAEILQLTEEVVKVNLFRARQRIKLKYNEIDTYGL
ncbi:RNA polymerase sigma factor [Phocaeicola faecicola]|uniref:RNA polymerase sigma factor n=1 Tax=Phocaeicola faecicola TaxID=2739389 RepID=UPI0015B653C5|nr:sigma-70 family RNA polymerase sigma factor [Phocaeicola faecicola]MCI5744252.1 sigma-70 family RNA polymerase sigma factor [Bacteroides sp.]MDD6907509.1 sigma-70 family RNA polymerase sigma factor [Bacteroidaceae bacterium]MDY4872330.1 sigma-70 family RNA polymerase sigma factor [Phocaeicola faecicola]